MNELSPAFEQGMKLLSAARERPISAETLLAYWMGLRDLSDAALAYALHECLVKETHAYLPSIATIREYAKHVVRREERQIRRERMRLDHKQAKDSWGAQIPQSFRDQNQLVTFRKP